MIEGINFFKKNLSPFSFFEDRKFYHKLKARKWWNYKGISFADFFKLFLPGILISTSFRLKMREKEKLTVEECFIKNGIYEKGIKLFGNPFVPARDLSNVIAWMELFKLINEIMIRRQYGDEWLKTDSVVLDIGANTGVFSVLAANKCINGSVYSFEPKSSTFASLEKNISFCKNSRAFRIALGDQHGKRFLIFRGDSVSNAISDSTMMVSYSKSAPGEEIEITTIDDFVEYNNIKKIDFIKIDTEGYEKNVIKGAKNTLINFKPVIAMSAYHNQSDKKLLPELLKSINPSYNFQLLKRAEKVLIFY